MNVKTMTVSLHDHEGQTLSTTVDIPSDPHDLVEENARLRRAIGETRAAIGPANANFGRVGRVDRDGSVTFSLFYLTTIDLRLKKALLGLD